MQSIAFLAVFLLQLGLCDVLDERAGCNADNCLRKIRGTAIATPNLTSRLADCSSFLQVTIEPDPRYECFTVHIVHRLIISPKDAHCHRNNQPRTQKRDLGGERLGLIQARQVTKTPSSVPAYASACSGTARYSSACSCAGVTGVTTTAPIPTVTVTVTECTSYGSKCDGVCRDLYWDTNNCGTCGNVVSNRPVLATGIDRGTCQLIANMSISVLLAVNVVANVSPGKTSSALILNSLARVTLKIASQRAVLACA